MSDNDVLQSHLRSFDFENLFVEGLGWDFYHTKPVMIRIDDCEHVLKPVAHKAGFAVYVCSPSSDGKIPSYPARRRIEQQVAKLVFEHLVIFVNDERTEQIWQWVKRVTGKSSAYREHHFSTKQSNKPLLQRLQKFVFTLKDESSGITIADVTAAIGKALGVERVTKRFYDHFKTELGTFQKFIGGIESQNEREWYASLMLNRMMFIYFVQKQGFLDSDTDYLRNRLATVQKKYGSGKFQQFYSGFLIKLFHEGLGKPESKRDPRLQDLLGKIPYLNGGLFDVHKLESDNPQISIPDEAFEKIFKFFDRYSWHLDERPRRNDNEINPDVLGYIFEKYINQKQMGAYYTKDDITNYITRNTVIPFIFDAARKEYPSAFKPNGDVWGPLQYDPDRYIYSPMGHGVSCIYSPDADPEPLETPLELPPEIAAGLYDVSRRGGWNQPAPTKYALPTETWREVIARRLCYQKMHDSLTAGKISEISNLVTLNLNIERLAKNVVLQSKSLELLQAFWNAICNVSIIDPTCGSGAFLFAALNILEPLYTACIDGMRGFSYDLEHSRKPRDLEILSKFRAVLEQVDSHANQRYFILKSIILNNIYGVDIMDEAVEICKLRLFLKLMAQLERYEQIEPLPDIDFNIRTGNTLVGFTSLDAVKKAMCITPDGQLRFLSHKDRATLAHISKAAKAASHAFTKFRHTQTANDNPDTVKDKMILKSHLDTLRDGLDVHLAAEYGIPEKNHKSYDCWKSTYKPFHWFVEFYEKISQGGFDVIIGNPPYLESREVDYVMHDYACMDTGAIHALCIERSMELIGDRSCLSMIVPLSLPSTQRMKPVQDILEALNRNVWYANFAWRPAKLFDVVNRALTIFTIAPSNTPQSLSTCYQKWASECRHYLFDAIVYAQIPRHRSSFWAPKIGVELERIVLNKLMLIPTSVADFAGKTSHRIFYRSSGGLYWKVFTDFAPSFSVNGVSGSSSKEGSFSVQHKKQIRPMIATLSSNAFWWWYTVTSNLRDMSPANIMDFPVPASIFSDLSLNSLGQKYLKDITANSAILVRQQKSTGRTETQSFKIKNSKHVIDEIDRVLASHYNFTKEELDFIINYDIKYRMGAEE